jgi:GT2 family glycosyltransferase
MRDAVDASLIVISLNSKNYLRGCIDSILASEWRNVTYEIVVTDNGSTDGTLEMLASEYPQVKVMAHGRNLGFCKASNLAAAASSGKYLMFLNDDIIVMDDAIARLVEWMEFHPKVGAIGSRLLNIDGTDQHSSGRTWPTPMNALFGRKSMLTRLFPRARWAKNYLLTEKTSDTAPYKVDWLSAAALMVGRDAYEAADRLDENFYYFHELIFCRRLERAGYASFLDPQSKIMHYEGAGSGLRTLRVRKKHVIAFHKGAYHWYCVHSELGHYNPVRVVIAGILALRAALLVGAEHLRSFTYREKQLGDVRPEGGTAL